MLVWSSHIAAYGSTGQCCQFCWWLAERKIFISLSPFGPENLVSRDRFGRLIPHQPAHPPYGTQAESGAYSRDFSRFPRQRPFIYTANLHRICPKFISSHANACRRRSLPRVHQRRANTLHVSSSNGCCLFKYPHGPYNLRLSFITPITVKVCKGHV